MKRVTIFGSFSGRNKGDLALLRSELIQLQKESKQELIVYIFTKDPAQLRENLSDIIASKKSKINIKILRSFTSYIGFKTLPTLIKSDKVIIGGGGLFFDNRILDISFNHLPNLLIITLWLKLLGKEMMIYAVGCSHLNSRLARWMTKVIINNAKIVSVRDELSKRILSEFTTKEIVIGADPAFLLEPKKTARAERIAKSWPEGKKILLSLHQFMFMKKEITDQEALLKQFLSQVCRFAEQNSYSILTYTNYTDQKFALKIARLCGKLGKTMLQGENHLLPEEIIYLFSKVDFVIATQMHVGIFACLAKVPLMSVVYDNKVEQFNKRIGNQNYLHIPEIGDNLKVAKVLSAVAASKAISWQPLLQINIQKLVKLLNEFVWS